MVRVISIRHSTPAGLKLTKLFGIYDFSVAKDSGKVLIIIIYCFYNYYYYPVNPEGGNQTSLLNWWQIYMSRIEHL